MSGPSAPAGDLRRQLHAWWETLAADVARGPVRADRARLRRLRSRIDARGGRIFPCEDAWALSSFWSLRDVVRRRSAEDEELAIIASLLARVRDDAGGDSFAGPLGRAAQGGRPPVAEERFRRLLRADTLIELHAPLVGVLDVAGAVAVAPLAGDLVSWSPKVRRQWARDYWTAAFAQPAKDAA
jgi:CRISPR type I-E-associated protein CasB/Cse2